MYEILAQLLILEFLILFMISVAIILALDIIIHECTWISWMN